MNEQVEKILAGVGDSTFQTVARRVLGDTSATLLSPPRFEEITTSHADIRTIGIVKISGTATGNGTDRDWSCVVKIVDPKISSKHQSRANLENEALVYELGLFTGDEVPLRSAKYYLTANHQNGLSSLWLEDLSNGAQPPWSLELFKKTANHIGQFNGYHSAQNTKLPIDIPANTFLWRHQRNDLKAIAAELIQKRNTKIIRDAYAESSLESAVQFFELVDQLLEIGPSLPHGLAFGDTHARNLFPVENRTIGIDWGTVGIEPLGSDVGVLAGSGLAHEVQEAALVIQNERSIYDAYVEGLRSRNWNGNSDELRLGFYCQFSYYLSMLCAGPVSLFEYADREEFIEKRFGVPFDNVAASLAPVLAEIPKYTAELKFILEQVKGSL